MLRQNQIAQVIDIQEATYKPHRGEIQREQLPLIKHIPEFASIITATPDRYIQEVRARDLS